MSFDLQQYSQDSLLQLRERSMHGLWDSSQLSAILYPIHFSASSHDTVKACLGPLMWIKTNEDGEVEFFARMIKVRKTLGPRRKLISIPLRPL